MGGLASALPRRATTCAASYAPAAARRTWESDSLAGRAAVSTLPESEFPALVAASSELAGALAGEDEFDAGLQLLLDGLEGRLASAGATAR